MGYVNISFIEYCQAGEKTIRSTKKFIKDLNKVIEKMNSINRSKEDSFIELNQQGYELIDKWVSDVQLASECLDIKAIMRDVYVMLEKTDRQIDYDIDDIFNDEVEDDG
jgi:hypothetical protein